jgi:poly(hydroxyalkanoate) granule-associated protein
MRQPRPGAEGDDAMPKTTASRASARGAKRATPAAGGSAQRWPAGLDALAKAQHEGVKVFESLLKQGQKLERRTKQAAAETAAAARGAATAKAREMQQIAGGTWDKLEQVFEERVARALSRLGFYTQQDIQRLTERVDALSEAVNRLAAERRRAPASRARKAAKPAKGRS